MQERIDADPILNCWSDFFHVLISTNHVTQETTIYRIPDQTTTLEQQQHYKKLRKQSNSLSLMKSQVFMISL